MRQLIRLQILFLFLLVFDRSYGQEEMLKDSFKINIEAGELKDAIQELSNHTGIRFGYREKTISQKTVDANIYNTTLEEILRKLIVSNQLCYLVQGKQIIIHTGCLPKYYSITGYIIEDSTYNSLPYISVSILGKPIGVIADQNGYFELDIPLQNQKYDTLVFSSLGFYRDTLVLNAGVEDQITLAMTPKTYPVPEITVRPLEYITERLGNSKGRPSGSLYLDTHGQQSALRISNSMKSKGVIQSVEYFLSKKGNTDAPFRVRIFKVDSTGKPGKDLIEDAIVVKPEIEDGWYSVDISMLEIEMPSNGVFVSMEGVFPDDYESYFGSSEFIDLADQSNKINTKDLIYGQRVGYNKKGRHNTWHFSMSKVWFQLEKQSFGVMIAAVVKYEKEVENKKNSNNE